MLSCRLKMNSSTLRNHRRYLTSWLVLTAFLYWPSEAIKHIDSESQIHFPSRRRLQKEATTAKVTFYQPVGGRELHHSKSSKSKSSKVHKSSKHGKSKSKVGKSKSSKSKAEKSKSSKSKAVKSKSSKAKTSKSAKSSKSKFSESKSKSQKGGKSDHLMKIYEGGYTEAEKAYPDIGIQLNDTSNESIEQSTTEFDGSKEVLGDILSPIESVQSSAVSNTLINTSVDYEGGDGHHANNSSDSVNHILPSEKENNDETYVNFNLDAMERIEGIDFAKIMLDEDSENESEEAVE
ncbi:hypothetical protein ACHAXS_011141 [Conticribra weissflogii]